MPLRVQPTRNYTPCLAGATAYTGAHHAMKKVDAGNYEGQIGTIGRSNGWRIDRQRPMPEHVNLQIQKDGVGAPSSIAVVLVPKVLASQVGPLHSTTPTVKAQAQARFGELTRAIHKGLNESIKSRRLKAGSNSLWEMQVYEITGSFSS